MRDTAARAGTEERRLPTGAPPTYPPRRARNGAAPDTEQQAWQAQLRPDERAQLQELYATTARLQVTLAAVAAVLAPARVAGNRRSAELAAWPSPPPDYVPASIRRGAGRSSPWTRLGETLRQVRTGIWELRPWWGTFVLAGAVLLLALAEGVVCS